MTFGRLITSIALTLDKEKMPVRELEGYEGYRQKVRYRLCLTSGKAE